MCLALLLARFMLVSPRLYGALQGRTQVPKVLYGRAMGSRAEYVAASCLAAGFRSTGERVSRIPTSGRSLLFSIGYPPSPFRVQNLEGKRLKF